MVDLLRAVVSSVGPGRSGSAGRLSGSAYAPGLRFALASLLVEWDVTQLRGDLPIVDIVNGRPTSLSAVPVYALDQERPFLLPSLRRCVCLDLWDERFVDRQWLSTSLTQEAGEVHTMRTSSA